MISFKIENHEVDWHRIRQSVFIEEQGFENEFDKLDEIAHHVVVYVDSNAIGCGRTYGDSSSTKWHLGRLAILKDYRKAGYGAIIIKHLESYAKSQNASEMILSAQQHAISFYQKQGYEPYGAMYFDEHVEHQNMRKVL